MIISLDLILPCLSAFLSIPFLFYFCRKETPPGEQSLSPLLSLVVVVVTGQAGWLDIKVYQYW